MNRFAATCLALSLLPVLTSAETPAPAPASLSAPAPVTAPARVLAPVPVRVRVIRGSRQGPAKVDPRLADLQKQLGKLAYLKWEQVEEAQLTMVERKTQFVDLPDGNHVGLTVQEVSNGTVTVEVALAQRNTVSRLTIDKEKRIVHQVTGEKSGTAYFVTFRAWP